MADKTFNKDLTDSKKDEQKLQQDTGTLDLPEVKDIPGQEHIHVPDLREMADTTISSDDEEGIGLFEDENGDATGERLGAAKELSEDDLIADDDELEAELDDEEIKDTEDELDVNDDAVDEDSDVTEAEKKALEKTEDMDTQDNENVYRAELDDEDFDGEKLNEDDDVSGKDLDVPGAEEDDTDEAIGEEDEENNDYSLSDTE